MRPYFAYGSNMWDRQMRDRCPKHEKVGHAVLPGYRWIINQRGYATVVESPKDAVEGILFRISESDEQRLDKEEGVNSGVYYKATLPVLTETATVEALIYIDLRTEEGPPKAEYVERMKAALNDANLSQAYVDRYIRKFIPLG